jgi:hypothetical protein
MPLIARKALDDARAAHALLRQDKKDSKSWRPHWVACLALLRAVGHVLKNADGTTDDKHKQVIALWWKDINAAKAANSIFFNFVEAERNNVLKEYQFGVVPEPNYIVTEDGRRIVTEDGKAIVTEGDYFKLSVEGYEGQEGRDVIREALDWWTAQLATIEKQL